MGWLAHQTERRRLEIILDPAASGPSHTKNKRVQVNMDEEIQEMAPSTSSPKAIPATGSKWPKGQAMKRPRKISESEPEEDTKIPKGKKKDKKVKGKSRSRSSSTKPNTSAYGDVTDTDGKRPKRQPRRKAAESDSDVSHQVQPKVNYEGHSDSLTDS